MIYLAGPIYDKTDAECHDWRHRATAMLARYSLSVLDPMRRDYRGKEAENIGAIVRGDKGDILRSKAVLANCSAPSWGTAMEIIYASENCKTVFGFGPMKQSPWVLHHCYAYEPSLEDAVNRIVKWYCP